MRALSAAFLAGLVFSAPAAARAGQVDEAEQRAIIMGAQREFGDCVDSKHTQQERDLCYKKLKTTLGQIKPVSGAIKDSIGGAITQGLVFKDSTDAGPMEPEEPSSPKPVTPSKAAHDAEEAFVHSVEAAAKEAGGGAAPVPSEKITKAMDDVLARGPTPNYSQTFAQYALATGDDRRAERYATQELQQDPGSAQGYALRSAARMRLGNPEGARADALQASRLDPENPLGKTMVQYSEALQNRPGLRPPDTAQLSRLFKTPDSGTVSGGVQIAGGRTATLGSERSGGASFAAMTPSGKLAAEAEGLAKLRDFKGALRQAALAIQADPNNAGAYASRAKVWNRQERWLLAQQDANNALRLDPNNTGALGARAFAYAKTGHYKEAAEDARRILAADPQNAAAYLALAMSAEGEGDLAAAKEHFKRAAQLNPSMKEFLDEFLSQHPELKDGAAGGGLLRMLPAALRSQAALGAVGAVGLLAAAVLLLGGSSSKSEKKTRAPAAARPAPAPAPAYSEPEQGAETLAFSAPPSSRTAPPSNGGAAVTGPAPRSTGPNGGQLIAGNYEVRKELGRGGMGVVYEAFDNSLGRKVAIKEMREEIAQSARDKERFLSEARTVAKFQHPNIVAIYAILEDQGRAFLVFEHVDGGGLDKLLDTHRKLGAASAVPLLKAVAAALDYSHSRKVIHRDLKPSNIMISSDGVVKVMDFGIAHEAKLTVSRLTNSEAIGTMAYMPPEQELGQASKESDVFAFAVMAYETLLGVMPFPGPNFLAQKKDRLFKRPSQADASMPTALDAVFEKALDPEPKKRHASAGAFVEELARALS